MRDDGSIDPTGTQQPAGAPYDPGLTQQQAPPQQAPQAATGPAVAEPGRGTGVPATTTQTHEAAAPPSAGPPTTATQEEGIWDAAKADEFRHRWHDVQTHFVEDPKGSVTEARQLVDEAVQSLTDSVRDREEQLEHAGARASDSTEGMRDTVLQYHRLLDRLLAV